MVPLLADSGHWERRLVLAMARATMPTVPQCHSPAAYLLCLESSQALPWGPAYQTALSARELLTGAGSWCAH